jgi:hypothetical protein
MSAFDPEADFDTPVKPPDPVIPKKLTFYFPATRQETIAAGLSPRVEGGIQGGGRFGNVDLRHHTLEKYNENDPNSVVAVAMPGEPTGKRFPLNINGRTVLAWNVDTGGGLVPGQIDVATSDPKLARHAPIRGAAPSFGLIEKRGFDPNDPIPGEKQVPAPAAPRAAAPRAFDPNAEVRRAEPLPQSQQPGGKLPVEIGPKEMATLQHPDEQDYKLSVNRDPLIPSELIKSGYKTSPLYWLGKIVGPEKTEAIATGLSQTAAQFTTPENVGLVGATGFIPGGLVGKLAMTGIGAYFEAQAIKAFPEQWKEFKETSDPVKKWQVGSGIAVGLGLPLTALVSVAGMTHPDELTPAQTKNLNEALQPLVEKPAEVPAQKTTPTASKEEQAPTPITSKLPAETLDLGKPETDEEMLARQANEERTNRELQAEADKKAQVQHGWQQPLTGTTGDLGQGQMFGGEDLFAGGLSTADKLRMQREYEQELLAEAEQHMARGGDELVDVLKQHGLPLIPEATHYTGELKNIREMFKSGGFQGKKGGLGNIVTGTGEKLSYQDIFKKGGGSIDSLTGLLKSQGFDVETPADALDLIEQRLRTGKKVYGSLAKAEALEAARFGATDLFAMGLRRGQPDVGLKIIRAVQKAVDAIQTNLFGKTPTFEPPKLNIADGGKSKPPTGSVFAADTPPDGIPEHVYAMRITNSFKRWWEKFWPRDLSVHNLRKLLEAKEADATPVISAHQRFIAGPVDYLENFSAQPFWKALRGRSDEELIDMENKAVKQFRAAYQLELSMKGPKADRLAAKQKVLSKFPKWFQDVLMDETRIARESDDYRELGIEPPVYTGDPYLARLTNEDGKDVVDLNPGVGTTVGRSLRTTIGAFDNSRVHPTMKEGILAGTQYEPVARAVFIRELTSARLNATANLVRELKGKVLFENPKDALAASPNRRISQVRGLGPKTYYARSPEEAVFLEQNVSSMPRSPFGKLQRLTTTYLRDWNLVNPLPHVTKNMFVKYALGRINNALLKADVAEYSRTTPTALKERFDKVMPFPKTAERTPGIMAREVGTWGERTIQQSSKPNTPSRNFIFQKADPAMRYSLWKDYVRKGLSDQDAANHVWIDLIRYDANSGGMNFWKSIPFNFFVPWRTGTYVTLGKAIRSHPIRTILFFGSLDYLREMRYRGTGRWTHLPHDYLEAPLGEAINSATQIHDARSARNAAQSTLGVAATTLLFGPGGGQAPSTIKDMMAAISGDPSQKARIMNMFWGLSQIYNLPAEWTAFKQDNNPQHLVDMLTTIAVSEHSALKYEPRRLMKWLPDWMPGMQKGELVKQAEALQEMMRRKREKSQATYEERHSVSRTFDVTPERQQIQALQRAAGQSRPRKQSLLAVP